MIKIILNLLIAFVFFVSVPARAAAKNPLQIALTPHYGGGSLSNGEKVVSSQGVGLVSQKLFFVNQRFSCGPSLEIGQNWLSGAQANAQSKYLATYESKYVAAGFLGETKFTRAKDGPALYLSFLAGQGQAKMHATESVKNIYLKQDFEDIDTSHLILSLGTRWLLKGNVSLLAGLRGERQLYKTSQAKLGQISGDVGLKSGRASLAGNPPPPQSILQDKKEKNLRHESIAASLGFAVAF